MTHHTVLRSAIQCLVLAAILAAAVVQPSATAHAEESPIKLLPGPIQALKAADPDRNSTVPTGWWWWKHRTEAQINAQRDQNRRIIDLEWSPTNDGRFDAVFVENSGVYERTEGWWFNASRDDVVAKVAEKNGRITDLEPYTVNGQRRFAFALIRNEGLAEKWWWWNYDLTAEGVTADINTHGIRLVDLDVYQVNGQTRFSYVGIKNEGIDATAWWWYVNVTPEYVADRINEHNARLIDIERHPNGNLSVVMVQNNGTNWWWGVNASEEWMIETIATHTARIIDLESIIVNGERRYTFIAIDNANAETRRLRNLIYQAFDNPAFGDKEIRGFLVKEVGGPVLADQAGDLPFQPLSTLKLLPYLHAMIEIDDDKASLNGTQISWTETTVDNPNTNIDERNYASCFQPGAANTQSNSAPLADILPTMMWESHNRTLDAVLDEYTPTAITNRAHALGLTHTQMYFGCPQPDDSKPWAKNRSTLYELGRIFEGVEQLQFVQKPSTRQAFFDNLINLNYAGASYTSPITGKTVGPLTVETLRAIVEREAGPENQDIVDEFLQHVVMRGKGGGGGPSSSEYGYSDFLHVTLPFKENGQIVSRTFVVGYFIYKLETPNGCPESKAKDGGTCQAIWQPERDALSKFRKELHTAPIRLALATWTNSEPPLEFVVQPPVELIQPIEPVEPVLTGPINNQTPPEPEEPEEPEEPGNTEIEEPVATDNERLFIPLVQN